MTVKYLLHPLSWGLKSVLMFITLIFLSFEAAAGPFTLQVEVNGKHYSSYLYDTISSLAYPVPEMMPYQIIMDQGGEGVLSGITLNELVPVFTEAWSMTAVLPDKTSMHWEDVQLAGQLPRFILGAYRGDRPRDTAPEEEQNLLISIEGEVSSDTSISVWLGWEGVDELRHEIQRFAAVHGIRAEVLEVPRISSKLVQTHRGGGAMPDVVMVQSDYIYELASGDVIQPLDYLGLDTEHFQGLDSFKLFGRQWAVPFYADSQVLICSTRAFEEIGISPDEIKSLDDLERIAGLFLQSRRASGNISAPLTWNIYSAYWLLPFQLGFGKPRLIEPDGSIRVDDDATAEAVSYLMDLMNRGLASAHERDAMAAHFITGRSAVMLSSSYMLPELDSIGIPYTVVPFPVHPDTGIPITPLLDYKGFAISRRSRNPVTARRLIEHLTGIGVQQRFPLLLDKLPVLPEALELELGGSDHRAALIASSRKGFPLPPDIAYGVYRQVMWNMIRLIITGQIGVHEGLSEAQRLITAQLQRHTAGLPVGNIQSEQGEDDEKPDDAAGDRSGWNLFRRLRNLFR